MPRTCLPLWLLPALAVLAVTPALGDSYLIYTDGGTAHVPEPRTYLILGSFLACALFLNRARRTAPVH